MSSARSPHVTDHDAVEEARRIAADFRTRAATYDRDGAFPAEDFAQIRECGLLGLMVPDHLGGYGADFADYATVAMELATGNASTALVFNMHASVTGTLAMIPDDVARVMGVPESFFAMRNRVLADAAAGSLYAVAMSEREAGSRLSQLATTYSGVDGGFQIVGDKAFCSGAGNADAYVVAARSTDDPAKVSQFLVPATSPGITVWPTWDALGMRATASHDVRFDVTVASDALLGGVEGLGVALAQAMPQWLVASYAAVYVGVARATVSAAVDYVSSRGTARLPAVRSRIGQADAAASAASEVMLRAARSVDADPGSRETNSWVWRAKLLAGQTAMDVAASMVEACGAGATRRGSDLERLYRDARCGSLQPATSDVCADWLGMAALGLDPEEEAEVARW